MRFALFNFNPSASAGGFADFSHFAVAEPRANGRGQPIPLGRTITLAAREGGRGLGEWNGLLRAGGRAGPYPGPRRFVVVDRGQGRIALQAADGSGWVAVTGAGQAGDVKLVSPDPGAAATFQWEQAENGDVLLLSIVTDRCLAIDPQANGLLNAQARGIAPGGRNGASFMWTEASLPGPGS
ncbi:MAG TPA: hypothetical protein VFE31_01885 [Opitutaceae bacterium]|nr:hypothetical protein [Opitutaceae bacterium]